MLLASLLDTNSELVNAFKTYDDMLEQSALHAAKNASTQENVPFSQLQETEAPSAQQPQQQQITTSSSHEGEGSAAPLLEERTVVCS